MGAEIKRDLPPPLPIQRATKRAGTSSGRMNTSTTDVSIPTAQRSVWSGGVGLAPVLFFYNIQEVVAKPPLEVPEVATGLQGDDEANPSDVWPASATTI